VSLKVKISAIIPAFNEEKTIAGVINCLARVPELQSILVVDDGSTDATAQKAEATGAMVLSLGENRGKGLAMETGFQILNPDVIIFVDADYINLRPRQIRRLLLPVVNGRYDMTTGTLNRNRYINWASHKFEAPFSGIRVLRKELWAKIPLKYKRDFLIESAIWFYAKLQGSRVKDFPLEGVGHIMKFQKRGFLKGQALMLKMWLEIAAMMSFFCSMLARDYLRKNVPKLRLFQLGRFFKKAKLSHWLSINIIS